MNDSHLRSTKIAHLICFLPWIVSFLVLCLPLLIVTRYWEGDGYQDCGLAWPEKHGQFLSQGYTVFSSLYNYVLPLSIISWTYYKIFRKINISIEFNKSTNQAKGLRFSSQHDQQRIRRNHRARKILTPVVVVFAVALLPVNVFRLMLTFLPSLLSFRYLWLLYNLCVVATALNSSCNPFIYAIVSDKFRMAFKTMFSSSERLGQLARQKTSSSRAASTLRLQRKQSKDVAATTNIPNLSTGSTASEQV